MKRLLLGAIILLSVVFGIVLLQITWPIAMAFQSVGATEGATGSTAFTQFVLRIGIVAAIIGAPILIAFGFLKRLFS